MNEEIISGFKKKTPIKYNKLLNGAYIIVLIKQAICNKQKQDQTVLKHT